MPSSAVTSQLVNTGILAPTYLYARLHYVTPRQGDTSGLEVADW